MWQIRGVRAARRRILFWQVALFLFAGWGGSLVSAQELFSQLVGPVSVQPVADTKPVRVPYITWGGDVATFLANGGLKTTSDSIYGKMGLDIELVPGDDFVGQVKDYLQGKSPFLRGTMRMLGQASEVIGTDPRTKPVVILQLSWSAGDHIVARESIKTLNDLRREGKKVRIACQQGGPHVGLLFDSLDAAKIGRDEVEIVWVKDLTGANGPAELFRKDATIDACCVITPDMIGLTGGYDATGTGAEGTVKGAHVLNSTRDMSRSIADVYAVRSDWYQANKPWVKKFVAGYLKGTADLVKMRREFETTKRLTPAYEDVLAMAQRIFGKEVLPSLKVDAHGLLLDCAFVGLPGQIAFFNDPGNLSGFGPKMKDALDLAVGWGYAKFRAGFEPPEFDYREIAQLADVPFQEPERSEFGGATFEPVDPEGNTIVSFEIYFRPNQTEFTADRYGAEFRRALETASRFGNTIIQIRGHADPTKALREMVLGGLEAGRLRRQTRAGQSVYLLNGKPLDLTDTPTIVNLIQSGAFETPTHKPRQIAQAALNLSLARAEAVKVALVQFAEDQKVNLNVDQLQPTGAGIAEPVIAKPASFAEALKNMRVEFRIVRVGAEAQSEEDFQF